MNAANQPAQQTRISKKSFHLNQEQLDMIFDALNQNGETSVTEVEDMIVNMVTLKEFLDEEMRLGEADDVLSSAARWISRTADSETVSDAQMQAMPQMIGAYASLLQIRMKM